MSSLMSGRATVAEIGEPMQLVFMPMATQDIDIVALSTNTKNLWIGDHNVRAQVGNETGIPLTPGQPYHLNVVDLSTIWIDSTVAGEGVTWNAVNDVQ